VNRPDVELPPEAIAAAHRGNLIEAIKITREQTGVGLKEAKDAVEAHLGRGGSRLLRDAADDRAGDYLKRPVVFMLVAALIALAIYALAR
jgi:ribosomal L7/L12-like protein